MDDKERYAQAAWRSAARCWATPGSTRPMPARPPFNAEFQDFITRYAWGEIWTRPHFDERTRRILVIGTMMALGKWEEFRMHVRAALVEGGFTADDIKEIILQQAIYCGVPAANHAFKEAASVMAELAKCQGGVSRHDARTLMPSMTKCEPKSYAYPPPCSRKACGVMPVCLRKKRAKCEGSEKLRS